MSLPDDLTQLADLHARGVLSDDEFARAKARVLGTTAPVRPATGFDAVNALRRSRSERWLGGVCGGLASATGVAAWLWRLAFTLLVMCAGSGVLLYALMWILVPEEEAGAAGRAGPLHAG